MAHLTRLRMLAAADLLCHSQEKISSIAARIGYGDGFAFSTAFKREMGMCPQQFRATNRPEGIRP
jgi:AraC-like DNA-binding protein